MVESVRTELRAERGRASACKVAAIFDRIDQAADPELAGLVR